MTTSDMSPDYDQYLADKRTSASEKHEEAMRSTRVKIARIEAKRDVEKTKWARVDPDAILVARCAIAFFVLIAIIAICVTYHTSQPSDPTKQKIDQERYETCMQVEKDYDKCSTA